MGCVGTFNRNSITWAFEDTVTGLIYEQEKDFKLLTVEDAGSFNTVELSTAGKFNIEQTVDSYIDSHTFTIRERTNSAFLQIWFDFYNRYSTEEGLFQDALNGRFNLIEKIVFDDTQFLIRKWDCITFIEMTKVFAMMGSQENDLTFTVNLNFAPEIVESNFVPELPGNVNEPVIVGSATPSVGEIAVDITSITDLDGLIIDEKLRFFVREKTTGLTYFENSTGVSNTIIAIPSGTYDVFVEFLIIEEAGRTVYTKSTLRFLDVVVPAVALNKTKK